MKFIGNKKTVQMLTKWLKDFPSKKKYCLLHGSTGNGKTFLVYYLADKLGYDVFRITSESKRNICIQSINLKKLDGKDKQIILIDDINEIRKPNEFIDIPNISLNPVIFTYDSYPPNELRKGLTLEVKKPNIGDLFWLLQLVRREKGLGTTLTDKQIINIANKSPSVRSAINSLATGIVRELDEPIINIFGLRISLVKRQLPIDLSSKILRMLTYNMNIYTKEGLDVYKRFALYDADMKIKYKKSIDKFIVNNMKEPVEMVRWLKNY